MSKTSNGQAGRQLRVQRVVRRFVVQERYAEKTERDWYDDPDIHESVMLKDARTRLEKDLRESRGHGEVYLHRIIERTERVCNRLTTNRKSGAAVRSSELVSTPHETDWTELEAKWRKS